jgi:hypothetical protein
LFHQRYRAAHHRGILKLSRPQNAIYPFAHKIDQSITFSDVEFFSGSVARMQAKLAQQSAEPIRKSLAPLKPGTLGYL